MVIPQKDFFSSLSTPVIPVVILEKEDHAVPLAEALLSGGINIMEITLRTPQALPGITQVVKHVPEMNVGVGTLLHPQDVARVIDAGACFAVSPGFLPSLLDRCQNYHLPLLPGVATATEVMQAYALGLTFLKFFPSEAAGGIKLLKAWASPFSEVQFCPTGGIDEKSAISYLTLPNVRCVGGSWITSTELLRQGHWQEITQRARLAKSL